MQDFKQVKHQVLGPWRNRWGYTTTIAQFDDDSIIVRTVTPYKRKLIKHFEDWETCADFIDLIEDDRRF